MFNRDSKPQYPLYLSFLEIAKLYHPDHETQAEQNDSVKRSKLNKERKNQCNQLETACREGKLVYQGNIDGWNYHRDETNPHPHANKGDFQYPPSYVNPNKNEHSIGYAWYWENPKRFDYLTIEGKTHRYYCTAKHCTVHKDDFARFLLTLPNCDADRLLDNGWTDDSHADNQTQKPEVSKSFENSTATKTNQGCLSFKGWVFTIWLKEGEPKGSGLFNILKKYENPHGDNELDKNSPIIQCYKRNGQKGAGIEYRGKYKGSIQITKTTITKYPSNFKKNENLKHLSSFF